VRVAVTGAGGRLGRAVVTALEEAPFTGPFGPIAWSRAIFDLDHPERFESILDRDRPELVVHCAAWTDVDGCAGDPKLADLRNGWATRDLAAACVPRGIDLLMISTNEVFAGDRTNWKPYDALDERRPINPYGASKLLGEQRATQQYAKAQPDRAGRTPRLGIIRTTWLFGPPGNDFPSKILAAADRAAAAGEPVRVVFDEWGSPTYTVDVAGAIVDLTAANAIAGTHHVVNAGVASRADWAREVLRQAGVTVATEDVPASTWPRASTPPAWAVLEPTPLPDGEPLRTWQAALADYLPTLLRQRAAAAR
jgi:dTDP-4-dehydrorhamnose reductase